MYSSLCLPASYHLVSCLPVIIGILHDDDDVHSVCIQLVVPNDDINVSLCAFSKGIAANYLVL